MSKLEQLINELCPNGVEWKTISDVCNIITDYTAAGSFADIAANVKYTPKKEYAQLVRTTDLKSNFSNPDKFVYVNEHAFKYLWRVNLIGEGLILPNVGNCGEIYHYTANSFPCKNNVLGPNAILVKSSNANMRYLFHLFQSIEFQLDLFKITSQTGQTKFNKTNFKNISIPIPPLPVQEEIVRILDAFTDYTADLQADLQAELQARREQYEYYRNKLLSFEGDSSVEWKPMGDVGEFIGGNGLQKKDFTESGVGCIHYGQIYTHYGTWATKTKTFCSKELAEKVTPVKPGNLVIACTSENIEDVCKAVAWLGNEDIVTGGHAAVFCHEQDPKFISYLFQTEYFFQQKRKYAQGTKVIDIKTRDMAKIPIPIPPLSEQRRIVAILDKFEALVNDLTEGLPAEIAARQEQYEYYRDKLLNFPKAV